MCLIDGDGNIFSADFIQQGQAGGRLAASQLFKGLTDHLTSLDPSDASIPARSQLWLTIYCNKSGLLDTLTSNAVAALHARHAVRDGVRVSARASLLRGTPLPSTPVARTRRKCSRL